jgi:hypothetical protein
MRRLFWLAAGISIAVVACSITPDLRRYMKMQCM